MIYWLDNTKLRRTDRLNRMMLGVPSQVAPHANTPQPTRLTYFTKSPYMPASPTYQIAIRPDPMLVTEYNNCPEELVVADSSVGYPLYLLVIVLSGKVKGKVSRTSVNHISVRVWMAAWTIMCIKSN